MNQGNKYNNSKQQLIGQGSTSVREGFSGILGSNKAMDQVIADDTANTKAKVNMLNDNIAQYGTDYKALKEKSQKYINEAIIETTLTKNYNVFINKSKGPSNIPATRQKQCVSRSSISNLSFAAGFDSAYPANFTNYTDANNACKLWAADTGKTTYAITKDAVGKYQCSTGTGLASNISVNTKATPIYTVFQGDGNARQGGLFANGQIGVWGGTSDPKWNVTKMTKPALIKKYNSTDYSGGPQAMNKDWWGTPGAGGWGGNHFPNDKKAWWISNQNFLLMGTMGYFYFVYNSPVANRIGIYTVVDDQYALKVNGQTVGSLASGVGWSGYTMTVDLVAGKNVFEFKLVNTGGPGAFVFYAYEIGNNNNVYFRSGDDGWGYTMTQVSDYKMISNTVIDQGNPGGIQSVNTVPTGYEKCDAVIGGGIMKSSISASFGRNCSNITNPPLNVRYVKVTANNKGDCIQISQIVVNAFVNGAITNVAPRGTTTASESWSTGVFGWGWGKVKYLEEIAIDGTNAPRAYPNIYHSVCQQNTFWELDLGRDYLVTEIVYYNRSDCCSDRANGMKIQLTAKDGTVYQPIILSSALKQAFNISTNGLSAKPRTNLIKSMFNQKCIDQHGGRKDSLLPVIMWDCIDNNPNQDYTYNADQRISAPGNNICLDVLGGNTANGTSVIQYSCHTGANQKWTYGADKTLRPHHAPNKCLDLLGFNQSNGANLGIWDCNGKTNQQWDIKK